MEPITVATIVTAISSALLASGEEVAGIVVKDAYSALKNKLIERFGAESEPLQALENFETKPESESRKGVLEEELEQTSIVQDETLNNLCIALIQAVSESGNSQTNTQFVNDGDDMQIGVQGYNATVQGGVNFGKK